jgi:voltage-gated potassium channel
LSDFRSDGGYERWENWTEWPLVGLAVIFLVVLILPLAHPISPGVSRGLDVANVLIWALFAVDYLLLLYLALDRRRYVRTHVLELLVVVLPFLRPFRLLRLFAIVSSTTRRAGGRLVQRVTTFAVLTAVTVVATSAVVVFDAEKSAPDRNIKTLGDSMWWALTTVTTVGYGDRYPVTAEGRLIASLLMLTGIALLGVITAAVAAWFVNVVRDSATVAEVQARANEIDLTDQISELITKMDTMHAELAALRAQLQTG